MSDDALHFISNLKETTMHAPNPPRKKEGPRANEGTSKLSPTSQNSIQHDRLGKVKELRKPWTRPESSHTKTNKNEPDLGSIARERGWSLQYCQELLQVGVFRLNRGEPVFPIRDLSGTELGAHYRLPGTKSWLVDPKGTPMSPLVAGKALGKHHKMLEAVGTRIFSPDTKTTRHRG